MRRTKKRKVSVKKILRLLIPVLIVTLIFINRIYLIRFFQSKITGYKVDTINAFYELNVYDKVKKHDYSETTEKIVVTEYYNKKYVNKYLDIEYHEADDFFPLINKLLGLGYNSKDINTIYKYFDNDDIKLLCTNNYLADIVNILNLSYFKKDKLGRYLQYNNKHEIDYVNLITYVNIGLDNDYYTNTTKIDDPNSILVLVNKYHELDKNYVPSDLEAINSKYNRGGNNLMRKEAKEAFEDMCAKALEDNIYIYSGSAYRSYYYQLGLYNRYVSSNGFKQAETFSARAGYSEHQTGLATDVMNKQLDFISKNDKEYTWLTDNSYKYGFILRYPDGKENITGYMYEEWHFRYVGKDVAKVVYESNITYDEYVARQ